MRTLNKFLIGLTGVLNLGLALLYATSIAVGLSKHPGEIREASTVAALALLYAGGAWGAFTLDRHPIRAGFLSLSAAFASIHFYFIFSPLSLYVLTVAFARAARDPEGSKSLR